MRRRKQQRRNHSKMLPSGGQLLRTNSRSSDELDASDPEDGSKAHSERSRNTLDDFLHVLEHLHGSSAKHKLDDAQYVIGCSDMNDVVKFIARLEGRFYEERRQRLDMEMQLQAMTAANCTLHYNLTFMMLHTNKLTWELCSANQQLEELTSWLIQPCHWQDTSEEQPSSGVVSYPEYGSSFGSLDNNESSSRGSTHSNESSSCDESAVCGSTNSKESACDSDDGTDGGRSTCLPPEQWPPCNEDPEDGEWVFIPEGGSDEEHQLGENRAACSHTFAAAEVNLNLTTIDDPETPSGPSLLELPRSIEISSDDRSQSTRSRDSSQDCGPRDDRVDASCQTDFVDCAVRSSLQETSATTCFAKGDGECAPYDLLLPDMLPYLSVTDLLKWCQLSRQTRSQEALIEHVAEMGSMDRRGKVFVHSTSRVRVVKTTASAR
ncbi:unnamed protein product [Symbiodinium sp. CCMP2592]|nr:unnamed protein product [Symbiodinium sp. CCMP2592]